MPNEKQRLIYVAISRPRRLLCIGVPNSTTEDELINHFSDQIVVL
jgi:RNA recognition motif-containing protein